MKGPFFLLWRILSGFGGVLALSNIAERYAQDAIQWQPFIQDLLTQYRLFLGYLTDWLPFTIWPTLLDYLVIGFLFSSAWMAEMVGFVMGGNLPEENKRDFRKSLRQMIDPIRDDPQIHYRALWAIVAVFAFLALAVMGLGFILWMSLIWPWRAIDHILALLKWYRTMRVAKAAGADDIVQEMQDEDLRELSQIQWLAAILLGLVLLLAFNAYFSVGS